MSFTPYPKAKRVVLVEDQIDLGRNKRRTSNDRNYDAVLDFHLPSFRYAVTDKSGSQVHLLDWLFGVSIGYAF